MDTHYDVLGVPPDSTDDEIDDAFRDLAKVVHPDHGGDAVMFQVLFEAYEVLRDPATRAAYDRSLRTEALRAAARQAPSPAAAPMSGKWLQPSTPEERAYGARMAEQGIVNWHQTPDQQRRARRIGFKKALLPRLVIAVLGVIVAVATGRCSGTAEPDEQGRAALHERRHTLLDVGVVEGLVSGHIRFGER